MRGLQLALVHPELPTCADCQRWMHDPKTWKLSRKGGKPVPRPGIAGAGTPCYLCPKSDNDRPCPENELSPRNWRAVEHFYQVKGGGRAPAGDSIFEKNAGIIAATIDAVSRQQGAALPLIAARAAVAGAKG